MFTKVGKNIKFPNRSMEVLFDIIIDLYFLNFYDIYCNLENTKNNILNQNMSFHR